MADEHDLPTVRSERQHALLAARQHAHAPGLAAQVGDGDEVARVEELDVGRLHDVCICRR